jgi:hypothetical protein
MRSLLEHVAISQWLLKRLKTQWDMLQKRRRTPRIGIAATSSIRWIARRKAHHPVAFLIASTNIFAPNGFRKNAIPPAAHALFLTLASSRPLMNIIGNLNPSAANRHARSMPQISPSWISTTRQIALQREAQLRNVLAESNVQAS